MKRFAPRVKNRILEVRFDTKVLLLALRERFSILTPAEFAEKL
jgi:hypothetical protein